MRRIKLTALKLMDVCMFRRRDMHKEISRRLRTSLLMRNERAGICVNGCLLSCNRGLLTCAPRGSEKICDDEMLTARREISCRNSSRRNWRRDLIGGSAANCRGKMIHDNGTLYSHAYFWLSKTSMMIVERLPVLLTSNSTLSCKTQTRWRGN
jgi:hypothetical protein